MALKTRKAIFTTSSRGPQSTKLFLTSLTPTRELEMTISLPRGTGSLLQTRTSISTLFLDQFLYRAMVRALRSYLLVFKVFSTLSTSNVCFSHSSSSATKGLSSVFLSQQRLEETVGFASPQTEGPSSTQFHSYLQVGSSRRPQEEEEKPFFTFCHNSTSSVHISDKPRINL